MVKAMHVLVIAAALQATFAIQLDPDGVPGWHVEAVERTLPADVEDDQLTAVPEDKAEFVVRGTLTATHLDYEVVGHPFAGTIDLIGRDRTGLARALREVLHAAIEQREHPQPAFHAARLPPIGAGAGTIALVLAALFLASPFVVGALVWKQPVVRLRSFRRAVVAIAALAIAGYVVSGSDWALLAAGGLAWGTFAATVLPLLFPPLPGLGRVEHHELIDTLRTWAWLAAQRSAAALVVAAPFALALWAIGLPALITIGVFAPLIGLGLRLWIHSWVEIQAKRLDARLVDGAATRDNPWQSVVRGYVLGYVRRTGWDTDERLLAGVQILPGTGDDVHLYGGGLTDSRIVVPRAWLELALAPYGRPHDYAAPRVSTLEWNEWNAGLILPTEIGAPVATRDQRQPRPDDTGSETDVTPFGEPITLAGYLEPQGLDPRSAHRPWEDPLWLDYDTGEEHDGTDPSDKDFLFGLVVHELGRISRGEDLLATFTRRRTRAMAEVGELFTVLNHARHHRMQDRAWRQLKNEELLTARAYAPELARRAAEIRAAMPEKPPRRYARWILAAALVAALTGLTFAVIDAVTYTESHHGKEE